MRSVIKQVALKNTLYFVKYKKDKFLTVKVVHKYVILSVYFQKNCLFCIS
jgi:hypothetical protein